MDCCCENCGWSEIVGSPIICHYTGSRTWRDECCEAWKPKEEKTNMVEVVRCRDCKDAYICSDDWVICTHIDSNGNDKHPVDWFCADGERKDINNG